MRNDMLSNETVVNGKTYKLVMYGDGRAFYHDEADPHDETNTVVIGTDGRPRSGIAANEELRSAIESYIRNSGEKFKIQRDFSGSVMLYRQEHFSDKNER